MTNLEIINNKIVTDIELDHLLATARLKEKKIVFTNGCFDILHRGHISYLAQAADLGNFFIIGLNSDASVKRLKGPLRPLQDEQTRALVLASLHFVNAVILFNEETPFNLINKVQPDVLVKGGDYEITKIVGYNIVTAKGGLVTTIPFVSGFSTTSIINKMGV